MDLESTLQEYQVQLQQVELALRNEPENEELLKLKEDLQEVIRLTQDVIGESADHPKEEKKEDDLLNKMVICKPIKWKSGDKCLAKWHKDGEYYPAVVEQVVEDGSCTVIFDGYSSTEITQVSLLLPRNKTNLTNEFSRSSGANKRLLTKRELEQKLKEAKKRKKDKYAQKIKDLEEISEKEKNKWKSFNTKLASKTWKGVVKKNKFELPAHHENKIGVGTNSLTNRPVLFSELASNTDNTPSETTSTQNNVTKAPARYQSESFKQSKY